MNRLSEIIQSKKHQYFFYVIKQINILLLFLKIYVCDVFLILKKIKKDVKKYNLSSFTILYNSTIKYPLIGFRPSNFFMYKFYKNSYKNYLTFFEGISKVIRLNKYDHYLLDNKLEFKLHVCDKLNVPALIAYFDYKNKKLTNISESRTKKVVIKPTNGLGGKDIKIVSSDTMLETLNNCSRSCIAEEFINQHESINNIFSESVNTIRILTLKKNNQIDIVHMILKVGRSSTKHLDNIGQGGISVDIDISSGTLGKGYTFYEFGHIEHTHHPDTNCKFYGKYIPYFNELKDLAISAHEMFPSFTLVGWDISITGNGPIIVEGNRIPDLSLHQIHEPLKNKLYDSITQKH